MLAVSVILFAILVVALFARSWEFGGHGPGIMTKVKIFLTHFQVWAGGKKAREKGKRGKQGALQCCSWCCAAWRLHAGCLAAAASVAAASFRG